MIGRAQHHETPFDVSLSVIREESKYSVCDTSKILSYRHY